MPNATCVLAIVLLPGMEHVWQKRVMLRPYLLHRLVHAAIAHALAMIWEISAYVFRKPLLRIHDRKKGFK